MATKLQSADRHRVARVAGQAKTDRHLWAAVCALASELSVVEEGAVREEATTRTLKNVRR